MMTPEFVAAECAIRQLHADYVDAVWRLDMDAFGDCFTEDAEWRIDGVVMKGREDIVETNRKNFETNFKRLLLTLRTPSLDVRGSEAFGRTYFSAQNILADGTAFAPVGVYYEHFVDEGDRWRVRWRLFDLLYSGPPDMSGQFHDAPDYGPPPNMPPRDAMPVMRTGMHERSRA
ncbi:MAG: nuclear transport factor 2 family protein [Novosphingobium sp.]|nr:nuclear transport factor 2 family protein [Novosphingobium sp.]